MESFHGTPENREKHESLAQQIFPCLQYWFYVSCHNTQVSAIAYEGWQVK